MVEEIFKIIKSVAGFDLDFSVEASQSAEFGHYATNIAMRLASQLKRPTIEVARDLAERIRASDETGLFAKVEAAPPGFINFWLAPKTLRREFLKIIKAKKNWGEPHRTRPSSKQTVVIDYSHPNIAKPMSVAHLRSTIIGQALYNIFKFSGWKVIGDNHLGDWGKQFGILIAAYKRADFSGKKPDIDDLLKLYVEYTAQMESEPGLEPLARAETKKLQDGNPASVKIWKQFYKVSLDEFQKLYRLLGVKFDYYLGESFYKQMLPGIVKKALDKKIAKRSEGAVVITFDNLPPFVIQKSDDAFLYSTTDLAAIKYRVSKFKPDLILYVVDNGQSLYFEQLFRAAKALKLVRKERLVHVKFGLILSHDMKKLSTRAGRHIALDRVIGEAVERALAIVHKKRPEFNDAVKLNIARSIGIAALKYNDLSQNRHSDIAFHWDKMLNLEGNSAPYLMYTYARLMSILRKGKQLSFRPEILEKEADFELILKLIQFPDVLAKIVQSCALHQLTDYLYEFAKTINRFYHAEQVLKAETELRSVRLALIGACAGVLKIGLRLLGIEVLEKI